MRSEWRFSPTREEKADEKQEHTRVRVRGVTERARTKSFEESKFSNKEHAEASQIDDDK